MNDSLENETVKKIYDLIAHNPGIHLSKIVEILSMKISDVESCLQLLEKNRYIKVTVEAGYKQYFIEKRHIKTQDRRGKTVKKRIYDLIEQNPGLHLSK